MKAVFEIVDKSEKQVFSEMEELAKKYKSKVKREDRGKGYFILTESKLQIVETIESEKIVIQVWGATEEDIERFSAYWGEPKKVIKEKLSPNDFAKELLHFPELENVDKSDLLKMLEINEKEFERYKRMIKTLAKRKNATATIVEAAQILERY